MNNIINCLCGKEISKEDFERHFISCSTFKEKFNKFDLKLSMLIKIYSSSKEELVFVKFMLKRFIKLINYKLNNYENNNKINQDIENEIENEYFCEINNRFNRDKDFIKSFKEKYKNIIQELKNLFFNEITEEESAQIIMNVCSNPNITIFEAMNLIYREVEIIKTLNYFNKSHNNNFNIVNDKFKNIIENYKIYEENSKLKDYFLYIDYQDKRRQLIKDKNNYYNYIPLMKNNSNNKIFAKNENEIFYHDLFYKTLLCKYCDLSNENNKENLLCPYSHNILKDFRIIYNNKDEKIIKFMLLLSNKELFKFKNYLNYIPMGFFPEFNIDTFKIHKCIRDELEDEKEKCPINYHLCPYFHNNTQKNIDEQRRPPSLFKYSVLTGDCFSDGNYHSDKCKNGIFCPFLHSKNEYNYHEERFRKRFKCEREKINGKCKYYQTCYGIHSEDKEIENDENIVQKKKEIEKIKNDLNIMKCRKCEKNSNTGNIYFFIKCKHFICESCFLTLKGKSKNEKEKNLILACPFCDKISKSNKIYKFIFNV